MNDDLLDLKSIAIILDHKDEIKINPFKAIPEESLLEAYKVLLQHEEELN